MKKRTVFIIVVGLVLVMAASVFAGPKEDSQALVESAAAMVKEKGFDATLEAINDKNGPFFKGDLYIFVGKLEKPELILHPVAPQLVGKDMSKMKDVKGKFFFVEFMNTAKDPGQGWVEYYWPKPGEKTASPKDTFIMRVPGEEAWFACGYYK
jgi:cytochrome c